MVDSLTQLNPQQKPAGNLSDPNYYQNARNVSPVGGIGVTPPQSIPAPPSPVVNPIQAPDSGAIRRRLMGSTPGATDAAGLPYNANFDRGVSNLYAQTMADLAGYDEQEGQVNTGYEKARGYQMQDYDLAQKQMMDKLAFQGILSSGIATDQRALLGQKNTRKLDELATTRSNALSDLASRRLAAQSNYQQKLGDLETGYTSDLSKWVQEQAQQQAERQQYQAQEAANAKLREALNLAANPPKEATMDWGTFLGSLDPANLGTFTQPGGFMEKVFQNKANIMGEGGLPVSLQQLADMVRNARGY